VIVYVETNFILELALQQEDADSAEELLRLSESGEIQLSVPAFSIAEAFASLAQRRAERNRVFDSIDRQARDLDRSRHQQSLVAGLRALATEMVSVSRQERDRLDSIILRLVRTANRIDTDRATYDLARYYVTAQDLSYQDAIVLASVVADLTIQASDQAKRFAPNWALTTAPA
jgi:predicted nucleic acid-binding protein